MAREQTILVTGGAGYIGSHTCVSLMSSGFKVVVFDNLSNSNEGVIEKIEKITGIKPVFFKGDICSPSNLDSVFKKHSFSAVIHFAALKSVEESMREPDRYYETNVRGTLELIRAMERHGVQNLVFSSTAAVYAPVKSGRLNEKCPVAPASVYGETKLEVENILSKLGMEDPKFSFVCLRYFNAVGAHPSGLIGETPKGTPSNLMPFVAQVAAGMRKKIMVFGNDYPTTDGTGIRDYVHVCDLAEGHVAALKYCEKNRGFLTANLGTGVGHSVLEVINEYEKGCGVKIPIEFSKRRPGDVAFSVADSTLAEEKLGWKSQFSLRQMCEDSFRFQKNQK